jgi:hypothetical protein
MRADRRLIRAGFILVCLALVTGFAIPNFTNPKMALAAHVTGIINALLLIAVGLVWHLLVLLQRIDLLGVSPHRMHRIPHRRQIHDRRHASEIL